MYDFHVDYYTDIISKIRAKSSIAKLGTIIDGRDSLQIAIDCDLNEIPEALRICLDSYGSNAYLEHFPNIDNIAELKNLELCQALDNLLVDKLNQGDHSKTWASMPEIIQDQNFAAFQYSKRPNALRYHDIELDACLAKYTANQKTFKKQNLERDTVYVCTHEGNIYPKWHVWKCIYSELDHAGRLYVLIDGKWYRVDQQFVDRLDEEIGRIPRENYQLPPWKQPDKEYEYLQSLSENFFILIGELIRLKGQSPIEFCDIFIPEHTLIHVKRYGSSDVLSNYLTRARYLHNYF